MSFDKVLRLTLPSKSQTICFADDSLLPVEGKAEQEVCSTLLIANIELVTHWMQVNELQMAAQKTKTVLFHGWEHGSPLTFDLAVLGESVPLLP